MNIFTGRFGYKHKASIVMTGCRHDSENQPLHVKAPSHDFNSRAATFNFLVCVRTEDN